MVYYGDAYSPSDDQTKRVPGLFLLPAVLGSINSKMQ